jgi:hypothetical protein
MGIRNELGIGLEMRKGQEGIIISPQIHQAIPWENKMADITSTRIRDIGSDN